MSGVFAGKTYRLLAQALICCACLLFIDRSGVRAEWYQQQREIMGTRVSAELWHEDAQLAAECGERIFREMRRIDYLMSTYRDDSEVSRVNRDAARFPVAVSDELAQLIAASLRFSELSGGAFDITYASIGHAYDYRARTRPSDTDISKNLDAIDYRHLRIDGNRIAFADENVRIDLGGIAKGYAVDRAIEITRRCGIGTALISAGGDSRIIGDRRGRPWMIGVRHPRSDGDIALRLPLSESAISTSGDYERFFIDNGERVHHIINPNTGHSAKSSWSATVIGPDALTTDVLSTTIFILGADDGIALIESLEGLDAIIIDAHGKVHYTSGFIDPGEEG